MRFPLPAELLVFLSPIGLFDTTNLPDFPLAVSPSVSGQSPFFSQIDRISQDGMNQYGYIAMIYFAALEYRCAETTN